MSFYVRQRPGQTCYAATQPDLSVVGEQARPESRFTESYVPRFLPPSRAGSRPSSRNFTTPVSDYDPDNEPVSGILSRLEDYTHNWLSDDPLAYMDCECKSHGSGKVVPLVGGDDSGDGSPASDDEGVTVDVLLKMLQKFESKGDSIGRTKALLTLVQEYSCKEVVSEQHIDTVLDFVKSSFVPVQEASLILVKQLCSKSANVSALLGRGILDFLLHSLETPFMSPIHRPSLHVLQEIMSHADFKDAWIELVVVRIIPSLLNLLRGDHPLDVKYSTCCVFRSLAVYEDFIIHIMDDILPAVLLLRNASAKFKEVYVEILTHLISHTEYVPPDLVDSSAIPITISIIKEGPCGPQCAAFHLLSSLTNNDAGVAMVIGSVGLVSMITFCVKESKCRKVRQQGVEVMQKLTETRKIGMCRDLMLQISSVLVQQLDQESLTSLQALTGYQQGVIPPIRSKMDEDKRMWRGLEQFVDLIVHMVYKEGRIDEDPKEQQVFSKLVPGVDVSEVHLSLLTQAVKVLQNICLWPLDRSKLGFSTSRIDLTSFTEDEKQRTKLSKMNRGMTQVVWDKVGIAVTEILGVYSDKISQVVTQQEKPHSIELSSLFDQHEINLIFSLLELILCLSINTCESFPDILTKSDTKHTKSPNKLKSSSTSVMMDANKKASEKNLCSRSAIDVGRSLNAEGEKIWVKENPHLTNLARSSGKQEDAVEKHHLDLLHKEACTERRLLRKCLYEAAVFTYVCSFLKIEEKEFQVLSLQILRCLIQPLEEKIVQVTFSNTGAGNRIPTRPQTAKTSLDVEKRLNNALSRMSPDIADLIQNALGPRPRPRPQSAVNVPMVDSSNNLETIQEKLQEYFESIKKEPKSPRPKRPPKPVIDRCLPITSQCHQMLLQKGGSSVVTGIFSKYGEVKKHCVLLLHDLVHFGQVSVHMQLSEFGCMPKLMDFLRVNEDDELLEIMGLIIVRMLVSSDHRLHQLFNRHGGTALLMSMAQYTTGLVRKEVATTLKTVTKDLPKRPGRPRTAPVMGSKSSPDIWDHVQQRWHQQDTVTHVLRQWLNSR